MDIVRLDLGADSTRNYSLTSHDSSLSGGFMAKRTKPPRAELSETPSREKEEEKSLEQLLAELRVAQRNDLDWDRLAAHRVGRQRRD
jgi:hypothetical protein